MLVIASLTALPFQIYLKNKPTKCIWACTFPPKKPINSNAQAENHVAEEYEEIEESDEEIQDLAPAETSTEESEADESDEHSDESE